MHNLPNLRLDSRVAAIPHFEQYAGVWAIEERHLQLLVANASRLQGAELTSHLALNQPAVAAAATSFGYDTTSNVAVFSVRGTMTKYGSSFAPEGSTLRLRKALRAAKTDPEVHKGLIRWETPGGLVEGTDELADDIRDFAESKEIWSYVDGMCCSAGYWPASQSHRLLSNNTSAIGSIGVLMAVQDWSKAYEEAGVQVHVIRTGEHKGAGVQGAPIPDSAISVWQEDVGHLFEMFGSAVRKGRGMSKAEFDAVSSGRTWLPKQALDLKLIDGIQSFEKTLSQLAKSKSFSSSRAAGKTPEVTMSDPVQPVAATFKELVAACPGIDTASAEDSMFLADCQKRDLTAVAATAEWCKTLKARSDTARTEAAEAKKNPPKPPGVNAVNDAPNGTAGTADTSDPVVAWNEAVEAALPKNGNSRDKAKIATAKAQPDLYRAYVNGFNKTAGRPGRI